MKKLTTILICLVVLLLIGCPPSPGPTCTDGEQNQDETGIDCGGSCPFDCFDCNTDYCEFLSGAQANEPGISSIRWKCSLLNGETLVPESRNYVDYLLSIRITFSSNAKWTMTANDIEGTAEGTWKFDDPNSPTKITMCWDDGVNNCYWTSWINIFSLKMGELVEDAGGANNDLITYVHD